MHVAAAVRRGSEGPSEGIRRIRRGFPEEEPSANAEQFDNAKMARPCGRVLLFGIILAT